MTTVNVLIKGETKEQCIERAMEITIEKLIDWDKSSRDFHVMSKNNHVIFVTQKMKEECNILLDEALRYFRKKFMSSFHDRNLFIPENFRLKQEQNNSIIHFITLDELLNNLQDYQNEKEMVFKSIITDEFGTYQLLKDNGVANQLLAEEKDTTYFITTIDRVSLESMKIFSYDEFQYTIIL